MREPTRDGCESRQYGENCNHLKDSKTAPAGGASHNFPDGKAREQTAKNSKEGDENQRDCRAGGGSETSSDRQQVMLGLSDARPQRAACTTRAFHSDSALAHAPDADRGVARGASNPRFHARVVYAAKFVDGSHVGFRNTLLS